MSVHDIRIWNTADSSGNISIFICAILTVCPSYSNNADRAKMKWATWKYFTWIMFLCNAQF